MKWYKHDPDAFLAGTAELTLEEVGAYISLINAYYSRDGHLPDDDWLIARELRCNPRTWRKLKVSLFQKQKLRVVDGILIPNRGEYTLNEARMFSERQAKRARMRWERAEKANKNNCASMPLAAMPSQPQPQPHKVKAKKPSPKISNPDGLALPAVVPTPSQVAERELFAVAKKAMGKNCGGLVSSLIRHHNYDLTAARRVVDLAITKSDPREYLVATMRNSNGRGKSVLEAADRLIDRLGGKEAASAYVPGSSGPKPLDLDSVGLPRDLKLISSR